MSSVVRELLDRIVGLPEAQRAELREELLRMEEGQWREAVDEARREARGRGIDDDVIARAVEALRYGDDAAQ